MSQRASDSPVSTIINAAELGGGVRLTAGDAADEAGVLMAGDRIARKLPGRANGSTSGVLFPDEVRIDRCVRMSNEACCCCNRVGLTPLDCCDIDPSTPRADWCWWMTSSILSPEPPIASSDGRWFAFGVDD